MADLVRMPQKGLTEESALLSQWHVEEGDTVNPGQRLFALETGKAVFEVESEVSGTVLKRIGNEGDEIPIKAVVLVVGEPGEDFEIERTSAEPSEAPAVIESSSDGSNRSPVPEQKTRISPRARHLAEKFSVSYSGMTGSGPRGRILVEDIEAARSHNSDEMQPAAVSEPSVGVQSIPISAMRATIADRLSKSFFSAPHVFLRTAVEVDHLLSVRKTIETESGQKLSFNAFVIKLAAEALKRHPRINSSWQETSIQVFTRSDIGLAVALPDGLITPVVRDCGNKGIRQIDAELSGLIDKAKNGTLSPAEYANATFTISNLGGYGIEEFTAIINPPGAAILALGSAIEEPVVGATKTIEIRTRMRMTLACDHRPIDGAIGAAFLRDLTTSMQEPLRALL